MKRCNRGAHASNEIGPPTIGQLSTGFTLVEVLIALVVMTVGMLGMFALHIESLRLNRSAIYHHAAISLAADMAERLRASGHGQAFDAENAAWKREAREWLPDGSKMSVRRTPLAGNGLVRGTSLKRYDIRLQWPETGQASTSVYALTLHLPDE